MEKWWSFGIRAGIGIGDQVLGIEKEEVIIIRREWFPANEFSKI